jgi:5-(carboxyamino)imidazole ribonucleotide mutase
LEEFGVDFEINVLSAHRSPNKTHEYVKSARDKGLKVIIASAGMAAHLAGVAAANTTLPVIGVPVTTEHQVTLPRLLRLLCSPR